MRRDKVNEKWLADAIRARREQLWDMQGPVKQVALMQRYEKESKELEGGVVQNEKADEEMLPRQSGSLEWRSQRGEMGDKKAEDSGVMNMMAGHKDIKTITKEDLIKEAQRRELITEKEAAKVKKAIKPIVQLPEKTDEEAFGDMVKRRASIKELVHQIVEGCGQIGCDNVNCCLTANPKLHSALQVSADDKAGIITKAIGLQRLEDTRICASL